MNLLDKRSLHHFWTRLRPIKTWYFLAVALVCFTVAVLGLRSNYTRMQELKNAVYAADEAGSDVETALQNLRAHVSSRMNTDLSGTDGVYPPVQLKYTYERLKQAEVERVNNTNSQVYTEAQLYCEARFPSSVSGGPRVPCIQEYVKTHGTTAVSIPDAGYKFDFASPRWSPDAAGLGLAFGVLFLILGVARFILGRWLRAVTR